MPAMKEEVFIVLDPIKRRAILRILERRFVHHSRKLQWPQGYQWSEWMKKLIDEKKGINGCQNAPMRRREGGARINEGSTAQSRGADFELARKTEGTLTIILKWEVF